MKTIKCKLTVYFAEPFWVGVFERICDGKLSVAKVTFGAEPKDYDIQEFHINNISCNDGRIYYLLSWKNRWRYI